MRQRAVITGGAGFLGSHLASDCSTRRGDVVCLDNFVTGSPDNVEHLQGRDGFRVDRGDVTEHVDVPGRVDYVLHFASPASPVDYAELPIETLKVGSHRHAAQPRAGAARRAPGSCSPPPPRPTATRWCTRSPRPTGATSTRSGPRASTTRRSASPRRSTMAYRRTTASTPRSCGSSTPTARGCARTTAGRSRPSSRQALPGEPITVARRRQPDPLDLLRRRPGRGRAAAAVSRPRRPGEHRQPARDDRCWSWPSSSSSSPGRRRRSCSSTAPIDDPTVRRRTSRWPGPQLGWEPNVDVRDGLARTIDWFRGRPDLIDVAPRLPALAVAARPRRRPNSHKVAVVGTGYVGAVTARCLAWLGHEVGGLDSDPVRAGQLNQGQVRSSSPGCRSCWRRRCDRPAALHRRAGRGAG